MKLCTIDGREVAGRPGVILESGELLDLSSAPSGLVDAQWVPHSVVSILAAGSAGLESTQSLIDAVSGLDDAGITSLRERGALLAEPQTRLMSPLRRPGLMVINVASAGESPDLDPVYIKSPNTAAGHSAELRLPAFAGDTVTVTPCLAAILGKPLHEADVESAASAIAAYTLILELDHEGFELDPEGSAVDWRRFVESKQVPGSCPMGPAMITVDEIPDPAALSARVAVNGIETGNGAILSDGRNVADVVAHLSQRYGFSAGDLVAFSTQRETNLRTRLHQGDVYEVELAGLMTLRMSVAV